MKAADYRAVTHSVSAFVTTNSITQGQQAAILWPAIFATGHEITFAHTSFKWANLASHNAGVTVGIVGISNDAGPVRKLFSVGEHGETIRREAENINAYLVAGANVIVSKASKPLTGLSAMTRGNQPTDEGNLLLTRDEVGGLGLAPGQEARFIRRIYGSAEFIRGLSRYCLWIEDEYLDEALAIPSIRKRVEAVLRYEACEQGQRRRNERLRQSSAPVSAKFVMLESETTIVVPTRFFGESPLPTGRLGGSLVRLFRRP